LGMFGYRDSISSSYALASNGYGALPMSDEIERIRSPSRRCRLRFEHLRMSIIASTETIEATVSSIFMYTGDLTSQDDDYDS